jgi:hypothetical protein
MTSPTHFNCTIRTATYFLLQYIKRLLTIMWCHIAIITLFTYSDISISTHLRAVASQISSGAYPSFDDSTACCTPLVCFNGVTFFAIHNNSISAKRLTRRNLRCRINRTKPTRFILTFLRVLSTVQRYNLQESNHLPDFYCHHRKFL